MTLEAGTRLRALGGRLQPHVLLGLAAPAGSDELALGDRQTIWHLRTWQVGPRAGMRVGLLPSDEPTIPELSAQGGVCWVYTVSRTELGGQASTPVSDGGWTACGSASVGLTRQAPTWGLGAALTVELAPLSTPLAEPDLLVLPTFGLTWRKTL